MDEHRLARLKLPAHDEREVDGVVVEDQRRALCEIQLAGELEREELRRHDRLGEAAERAEGGDTIAGLDLRARRRAFTMPPTSLPGTKGSGGLDLVLAAGLEHLRKGDARRVHLHEHTLARRERMGLLGLGHVDQRQRTGRT